MWAHGFDQTGSARGPRTGGAIDPGRVTGSAHGLVTKTWLDLTDPREPQLDLPEPGRDPDRRDAGSDDESLELDRMKKAFLTSVSHELRTPLTSILAYSSMVDDRWEGLTERQRRDSVHTIRQQSRQMAQVIVDLLADTELDQGLFMVDPEAPAS